MKLNPTFLILSIACALVIFGLMIFLILQFNFLVGILCGLGAFTALTVAMMIVGKKYK